VKIVHLSFSKSGGAGAVANTLATCQKVLGHDSLFEYLTDGNLRKQPFKNPSLTLAASVDEYLIKNKSFENQVSVMRSTLGKSSLERVENADVVHLHWIPGQVSLKHLARVFDKARSVVWTLHDMWPFTGGCHYSGNCEGYQKSCAKCPAVKAIFQKPIESQLSYKSEIVDLYSSKLKIVAPSAWLADLAKSSTVFRGRDVSVIPNPVSSKIIPRVEDKHEMRKSLRISENSFVIAFSAANLDDKRKGLDKLLIQLELMARKNPGIQIDLLLVGDSKKVVTCRGVNVRQTGLVSAEHAQALLFAADVLVNFSREENLSMSLIEALSASVPIVALDSGGNTDVVKDGITGYLLSNPEEAASRLLHLAQDRAETSSFAAAALDDFKARFTAEKVSKQYLDLYSKN
jgi:glycosyltransferase involved in cell wall biosynthesis